MIPQGKTPIGNFGILRCDDDELTLDLDASDVLASSDAEPMLDLPGNRISQAAAD